MSTDLNRKERDGRRTGNRAVPEPVKPSYDAHGSEAWSLGRESYAHLGYMASIGPNDLRHHLIHAHGLDVERTLWVDHVEMHALSHEIRVRSGALRDIDPCSSSGAS